MSVFVIRAALGAEKLRRFREYCRIGKNTFGKLVVAVNLEAIHLIRVMNERSINDGGDFCLLWLVLLKSCRLRAVVSYT